ncbi:MAG: prenyltransferase/squalene oxidase repeat-containing protein [Luteolibacter sp.]
MDEYYTDPALQIEPPKKQSKFKALIIRLGLGAFTIAVLAHLIAIILAIFVFYKWVYPPEEKIDFLPGGGGGGGSGGEQVHKVQQQQQKRMMSNTAVTKRIASTSSTAAFSLPDSSNEMMDPGLPMEANSAELGSGGGSGGGHGKGIGTGTGSGNGPGKGFGNGQLGIGALIPTIMKGRCTDTERLKMVQEAGGTPQVEVAVKKSLQWLKGCQNSDGSWGKGNNVAMTGLVLLSYLGHCEGTQSVEYGDNVTKGMTYLINLGMKNGGRMGTNLADNHWVYEHAIGTYALCEALTFSRTLQFKVPELESTVEKAVDIIVKGQTKGGSWDYKYTDSTRDDLSVAGWQMQALKAAKASNVKIDNYDKVMRNAVDYLTKTAYLGDGRFAYSGKGGKPAMTAVGALCLQQHEKGSTSQVRESVKLIMDGLEIREKKKPKDDFSIIYSMEYSGPDFDIYASYYAAQVMRNAGGKEWDAMNSAILADILPAQKEDGSFNLEGTTNGIVVAGGSKGAGGSRDIYAQTLNTLILEVYYRFLPTSAGKSRSSSFDDLR